MALGLLMHAQPSRLRRVLVITLVLCQMVASWWFPSHPWYGEAQTAFGTLVIAVLSWPSKDSDTASPYTDRKGPFSTD